MKLKCTDGEIREFISLYEYYINKGFDPVFLDKDNGFLSLGMPPDFDLLHSIPLMKVGIRPEGYFRHWSKIFFRANPVSISTNEIVKEIDWIAIHPSLKNLRDDNFMGKIGFFTMAMRLLLNIWDFFALNHEKQFTIKFLLPGISRDDFKYLIGHKVVSFMYSENFKENRIYIMNENSQCYEANEVILGFSKYIYISLK